MDMSIVEKLHELYISKSLKLAVAESCTGGLISHLITNLPGASKFFDMGIVAYTADAKHNLLGVDKGLMHKQGTVSEDVAIAMAEGARRRSGADFALAITGIMGPDSAQDLTPGLVYIAVAFEKETTSKGMIFEGARTEIKEQSAIAAIQMLYEATHLWA